MSGRADYFPAVASAGGGGVTATCPGCGKSFRLMLHRDAKTAPSVYVDRKGKASADVPNAWPLPAGPLHLGGSCPGVTASCRDCYAAGIESWAPGYRRGASANLAALIHLYECGGFAAAVDALRAVVAASVTEQQRLGIRRPVFRWHSGGDVFAEWYARAIVRVCDSFPGVEFWTYTRTLSAVRVLVRARGLAVYVSADRDNVSQAARVAARWGVPLAMLAADPAEAAALWARAGAVPGAVVDRPLPCPVSRWSADGLDVPGHVVGADGRRSSARRDAPGVGACVACGACLPGSARPVTFLVHGGQARGSSAGRLGGAVAVRLRDRVGVGS